MPTQFTIDPRKKKKSTSSFVDPRASSSKAGTGFVDPKAGAEAIAAEEKRQIYTMSGSLPGADSNLPKGQFFRDPSDPSNLIVVDRHVPISLKTRIRGENQDFDVDHIVPLWLGGTNAEQNLQALDEKIHGKKTEKGAEIRAAYREGKISLAEARVKTLNWEEPKTTLQFLPQTTFALVRNPIDTAKESAETVFGIGKSVFNFMTRGIQRYIGNTATRVGEAVFTGTKAEKERQQANENLQRMNTTLFQAAKKKQAAGDKDGANKLLRQIQKNQGQTLEDILSPISKAGYKPIAGEALEATLDALPFMKSVGFVARGAAAAKKVGGIQAILSPKQLISTKWSDLGLRALKGAGEGGAYGLGYGISEVLQNQNLTKEQQTEVLIVSTGIGWLAGGALNSLAPVIISKLGKLGRAGQKKLTPVETQKLVQETIKETPIKGDKGIVTSNAGVKIITNQKTVLENFIKNSSRLNYKRVRSLPEGVQARFEWDFKRKQATIFTTKETTASNLAHELGHFYDRKLTNKFSKKLSELIPDYRNNARTLDSIFARAVVQKNRGTVTSAQISKQTEKLVNSLMDDIDKLAVARGEMRAGVGERFASAFAHVVDDPKAAFKIGPEFTNLIESEMRKVGILREGKQVRYKELFRGEGGEVLRRTNQKFENVKLAESQQKLLKEFADRGDKEAAKLLEKTFDYPTADKLIRKRLRARGFDAVDYSNKGVKGKPAEVIDLKTNQPFYLEEAPAKLASLQRKPAERLPAKRRTATTKSKKESTREKPAKKKETKAEKEERKYLEEEGKKAKEIMSGKRKQEILDDTVNSRKKIEAEIKDLKEQLNSSFMKGLDQQQARIGIQKEIERLEEKLAKEVLDDTVKKNRITTKAFNPSKVNTATDALKTLDTIAKQNDEFANVRRKTTLEEQKAFALKYLGDENLYKSVPKAIKENMGKMKAAQQTMVDLSEELTSDLRTIDMKLASKEQVQSMKEKLFQLEAVTKSFAGARTEASHLFSSLKGEVLAGESDIMLDMLTELKGAGLSSKTMEEFLVKKHNLMKPTVSDKAFSVWYAAILSGPKTQARNLLSNSFHFTQEIAVKFLTPTMWSEIPTTFRALPKGFKLGLGEAKDIMKGQFDPGKFIASGDKIIEKPIKGKFGTALDMVGRSLNAADKPFFRAAVEIEKSILEKKVAQGKLTLTPAEILEKANAYGEFVVYRNKPEGVLGIAAEAAQLARRKAPLFKIIVPFVRTVANVANRQLDYIPLLNMPRVVSAFKNKGSREGHQATARMFIGMAATTYAMTELKGKISGVGPKSYNERQKLMQTGWRPNSVKIGDKWYPYTYWGSVAGVFALAGNINDSIIYNNADDKEISELVANGMVGWANTVMDMSFLTGISNVLDVLGGRQTPEKYFTDLGVGLVPIPALYTQVKDIFFQRKAYSPKTAIEKLLYKLGFVENLQPKLDVFGEQVIKDTIYGITPSQVKYDEISRFIRENPDVSITVPSQNMQIYTDDGIHRKLTPQEYTEFLMLTGPEIKEQLLNRIESGKFDRVDPVKEVESIIRKVRNEAKDELWGDQDKNKRTYDRLQ